MAVPAEPSNLLWSASIAQVLGFRNCAYLEIHSLRLSLMATSSDWSRQYQAVIVEGRKREQTWCSSSLGTTLAISPFPEQMMIAVVPRPLSRLTTSPLWHPQAPV